MPTVPQAQRQVVDAAAPTVRVSAAPTDDTYGGQIGDTVARASVRMYDLQTRSSDHAAVVEAETRANEHQLRIQQEVRQLRGKEASNAPQYAQEEWGKVHEDIVDSLANDRQRAMYHSIGLQKGEIINRGALAHFNEEDDRYQEETFKANLSSSVNVARANADSPMAVAFEKDVQQMRIDEHAAKNGYAGTPRHQEAVTAVLSTTNKAVIHGLLDTGQDLKAKGYYDKLMKQEHAKPLDLQFTASDRDVVDKAIFEGSTRGASRRTAQELIGKHGIETVEQRKALLGAVDGIKDDKVADLVKQRVEHEFSSFDQLKKDQAEQNFLGASKTIEESWKQNPRAHVRDMVPVSTWNSLTPGEQHTLDTKLERLKAPEISHDAKAWFSFKTMKDEDLARMKPNALMANYLNKFDGPHYDRALNEYNAAINAVGKGSKDEKFVSALTTRERIKNKFNLSGVVKDPKKLSTEEAMWFDRFEGEADKALSSLPKDAKPEEIDKVLSGISDNLLKQRYTVDPGMFRFNRTVPAIGLEDVKDPRSIRIPLKEIPVDRQDALKGALRSKGLPLTTQNIEELEAKSRMRKQGVK